MAICDRCFWLKRGEKDSTLGGVLHRHQEAVRELNAKKRRPKCTLCGERMTCERLRPEPVWRCRGCAG